MNLPLRMNVLERQEISVDGVVFGVVVWSDVERRVYHPFFERGFLHSLDELATSSLGLSCHFSIEASRTLNINLDPWRPRPRPLRPVSLPSYPHRLDPSRRARLHQDWLLFAPAPSLWLLLP